MGDFGCRRSLARVLAVAVGFGAVGVQIAGASDALPGDNGAHSSVFVARELASAARDAALAARRGDGTFREAGQVPRPVQSEGWIVDTNFETFVGDGLLTTSLEVNQVPTTPGTAGSRSARATFGVDVCPDAGGNVDGSGTLVLTETLPSGTTGSTVITISSFGKVGDDAGLREVKILVEGQIDADRANPGGEGSWVQGTASTGTLDTPTVEGGPIIGTQSSEDVTSEARAQGNRMEQMVDKIYRAAEKYWQNNGCVTVDVTPSSKLVKPKEKFKVSGKAISKTDGGQIKRALTGTLLRGTTSLDGGDGKSPTTTFAFVGPKDKDKGVVRIKSTSKRGIGWTDVTYTTKALDYTLNADVLGLIFTATKCGGIAGTWTVTIDAPDAFRDANRLDLTKRSTASFEVPTEPEPGVPVQVTTPLFPPPRSESFIFTFYADGSEVGAPADAPRVGIDVPFGGTHYPLEAGDFCQEAN